MLSSMPKQCGTLFGTMKHSVAVATSAVGVCSATVWDWIHDYNNNGCWFSPNLWGANTKVVSLIGDVDTKSLARAWVIENMSHKRGQKNKTNNDFNQALHEHFSLDFDPGNRAFSKECSRALLHMVGARYEEHKTGKTLHDAHGNDSVAGENGQRQVFLDLYSRGG